MSDPCEHDKKDEKAIMIMMMMTGDKRWLRTVIELSRGEVGVDALNLPPIFSPPPALS